MSIMDLLDDFVQMSAETYGYPNPRDAESTDEVEAEAERYEAAVEAALLKYVTTTPLTGEGYGEDPETDAWELLDEEGPYLILMTLNGTGVGIWDGRWDHFFADPKREIPKLTQFLKQELSSFADDTGGGSLNEAFANAAWETAGKDWDEAANIASGKAIDEENYKYIAFLEERGITYSDYDEDEVAWEEDVKNFFDSLAQDEDPEFWDLVEEDYERSLS